MYIFKLPNVELFDFFEILELGKVKSIAFYRETWHELLLSYSK